MDIFLVVKVTDVNNNPLKKCSINVDFGGIGPGMGNQTAQPAGPDGTFEVKVPDAADIVSVTVERPPSFLACQSTCEDCPPRRRFAKSFADFYRQRIPGFEHA